MTENLVAKIRGRRISIAVVGLGRVGLPVAAIFANAGYRVIGADVRKEVVNIISSAKIRSKEPGLNELAKKGIRNGMFHATTNITEAVREADIIMICVQTPLTKDKAPNLTFLEMACQSVASGLSKGKLVVIESTVPPGTTNDLVAEILGERSGLKCGEDFWLAYSPERMASGRALQEFVENDRVVGGYDTKSAEIAAELFKTVTKGRILVADCKSVEVAKLAENTFRDVNIAFANELALICEHIGIDIAQVIVLANTHRRVNIHKPGCGVGGPCLTKDPYLLLHPVKREGFKSLLIEPSRELNDLMPEHTVKLVLKALKKAGKDVKNSKIVVLGVAYKGESNDSTNSPAEGIIRKMLGLGAEVIVYDPYCEESYGARKAKDVEGAAKEADCIMIATDHKVFKELELEKVRSLMNKNPIIVDGRRVLKSNEAKECGFLYFGVGYNI